MNRHQFLRGLHQRLRPRTYLEVGVNKGDSLSVVSCPAVGIDPGYTITSRISCPLRLYRTTSDDYFLKNDPRDLFGGLPIDFGFVDGMHLSEFAYRDVMNTERVCGPASVVVIDDMLPRDVDEAARDRHTGAWAGDVFKVAEILRRRRPDLTVLSVDTQPTGVVVVVGLDPASTVLAKAYDAELDYLIAPDPQDVPPHILTREQALDPVEVLSSSLWADLARLRDEGASPQAIRSTISSSPLAGGPAPVAS